MTETAMHKIKPAVLAFHNDLNALVLEYSKMLSPHEVVGVMDNHCTVYHLTIALQATGLPTLIHDAIAIEAERRRHPGATAS